MFRNRPDCFADHAKLFLRASCDAARFGSRLSTLEPNGRTAMAQAIRMATRQLRRRDGDKTILLVTDGMPDSREVTLDAARLARAHSITLVAIGIGHADETFLEALTLKPELAAHVAPDQLERALGKGHQDASAPPLRGFWARSEWCLLRVLIRFQSGSMMLIHLGPIKVPGTGTKQL